MNMYVTQEMLYRKNAEEIRNTMTPIVNNVVLANYQAASKVLEKLKNKLSK